MAPQQPPRRKTDIAGFRVSGAWKRFIIELVNLYNLKEHARISESDIYRMILERGASIVIAEFKSKYGESPELMKGAERLNLNTMNRIGWAKPKNNNNKAGK